MIELAILDNSVVHLENPIPYSWDLGSGINQGMFCHEQHNSKN
jgi:hypothetical protein